jgi:hypothetical protein
MSLKSFSKDKQTLLFSALLFLVPAIIAVLLGVIIAQGNIILLIVFFGAIFAVLLLRSPVMLLWSVIIGGLVFSGLAELYLPQLRYIRWAVVLGALTLMAIATFRMLTSPSQPIYNKGTQISPLIWMGAFALVTLFSGIFNYGLSFNAVIGLKGYFQVWGIACAMAWLGLNRVQADQFIAGLVWLAVLQIPFALHQFLYLVPLRLTQEAANKGIVAPDIVVGTFVASMEGGGANIVLASLQVIAISILIGFWRMGKISGIKILSVSFIFLVPIALNEAKAVVIFIPLMLAIMFQDTLIKRPFQTIFGAVLVLGLMLALLVGYSLLPRADSQEAAGLSDMYKDTIAYNLGNEGYGTNELNRTTVYSFWASNHGLDNLPETLVGHGLGTTNDAELSLMRDSLAKTTYYEMGIGLTALSSLLWEVGFIGTFLILGIFSSAFLSAHKLANQLPKDSSQYVYLKAAQVGFALLFVNVMHNNYLVFEIGFQTLLMVLLGYILHFERTAYEHGQ